MDQPSKLRPTIESQAPKMPERPVAAIVSELWENTEKLARQELQLGLAHLNKRTGELKAELLSAAISGALLFAGALTLLAAIVLALSKVIEPWLAALLVGLVVSGVGYALLPRGHTTEDADSSRDTHRGLKRSPAFKET